MTYRLTPDGGRYLSMAHGNAEPLPFHFRWLLPRLCRHFVARWIVVTVAGVLVTVALTGVLALQHGATPIQALIAMGLIAGLPSIRFCWFSPVLVDMPCLALALGAAVLYPISPWAALGVCLLGGAVSEKTPVLAAVFSLQPLLLAGLAVPIARWILVSVGKIDPRDALAWTLSHPFQAGRKGHAGKWRDPRLMLLPWGVCLVVLGAVPSLWLGLALAVAYAQLLVATDSVRLYQQAAPVVCVSAALMIPESWLIPALVIHWFNPFAGSGL